MEASDAEIKKAYRKLSLKYHPGTTQTTTQANPRSLCDHIER